MKKRPLPTSPTPGEIRWGFRYLLFHLAFLGTILTAVMNILFPRASAVHLDFAYFLVNFSAVLGIFHRFLGTSLRYTAKNLGKSLLTALLGFLIYEIVMFWLTLGIARFVPGFFNVNDASIAASIRQDVLLMTIGTVVLAPVAEEVLFRGLIFGLLHRRGRVLCYIVSTLIFCAIHVMGYVGYFHPLHLLICFIQYIPAGLVLGWAYESSGSIFSPIAIHMAVNAMGILSTR